SREKMGAGARVVSEAVERRVMMSAAVAGSYRFEPVLGMSAGYDVAVTADGKTVAVGASLVEGSSDVLAVRYLADGSIDQSFGAFGAVTIDPLGGAEAALAVALAADGRIVIAGQARRGERDVGMLVRLNADG